MIRPPPRSTLLSLHDALPISTAGVQHGKWEKGPDGRRDRDVAHRSEEHTSELQSRRDLVCRLLLEKKKKKKKKTEPQTNEKRDQQSILDKRVDTFTHIYVSQS